MKKVIYLASKKHRLSIPSFDIKYNDILPFPGVDYCCDMLDVDLSPFDIVIATPPCNYYSRANYRRETSRVALLTKHLLPSILLKLHDLYNDKPCLVENVCNSSLLPSCPIGWYEFNFHNHHYYTNVFFLVPFRNGNFPCVNKAKLAYGYRDNNASVDYIIRCFLDACL